jgi:hypothetical protein
LLRVNAEFLFSEIQHLLEALFRHIKEVQFQQIESEKMASFIVSRVIKHILTIAKLGQYTLEIDLS